MKITLPKLQKFLFKNIADVDNYIEDLTSGYPLEYDATNIYTNIVFNYNKRHEEDILDDLNFIYHIACLYSVEISLDKNYQNRNRITNIVLLAQSLFGIIDILIYSEPELYNELLSTTPLQRLAKNDQYLFKSILCFFRTIKNMKPDNGAIIYKCENTPTVNLYEINAPIFRNFTINGADHLYTLCYAGLHHLYDQQMIMARPDLLIFGNTTGRLVNPETKCIFLDNLIIAHTPNDIGLYTEITREFNRDLSTMVHAASHKIEFNYNADAEIATNSDDSIGPNKYVKFIQLLLACTYSNTAFNFQIKPTNNFVQDCLDWTNRLIANQTTIAQLLNKYKKLCKIISRDILNNYREINWPAANLFIQLDKIES